MPAFIPLNTFKTVTKTLPSIPIEVANAPLGSEESTDISEALIYTAPVGRTSIVLMAQAANLGGPEDDGLTFTISVAHLRPNRNVLNGVNAPWNSTEDLVTKRYILREAAVPFNDSLLLFPGKLVLETYDRLYMFSNYPNKIDVVCSILETANQ